MEPPWAELAPEEGSRMFEGSCHCGAVTFQVRADMPIEALSCNCSHCRRKGLLLAFVPSHSLAITTGEHALVEYLFNKHAIVHKFCSRCGCQPFSLGNTAEERKVAAINLRCVHGIDLDTLTVKAVDGASL
jgi:hypothetical protein